MAWAFWIKTKNWGELFPHQNFRIMVRSKPLAWSHTIGQTQDLGIAIPPKNFEDAVEKTTIIENPVWYQKRDLPCWFHTLILKSNSHNSFVGTWTNMTSLSLPKENIINNHPLSVGMLLGHYVSEAPQKGTITRNLECNRGSLWPLLPLQTHQKINPKIHRCIFPLQSTTMPPRELPEMNLAKPRNQTNNKTNNVWLYSGA